MLLGLGILIRDGHGPAFRGRGFREPRRQRAPDSGKGSPPRTLRCRCPTGWPWRWNTTRGSSRMSAPPMAGRYS
ncbi:hypothetical protein ACTMU2_25265 [Cupriavidus basilensis]